MGLTELSPSLSVIAEFLEIDQDLIAVAAETRPCSTSQIRLQGLTWFVTRRAGTR
jgi:hypothetical protein